MGCTEANQNPSPICVGCGVGLRKIGRRGCQPRWCSACKSRRYRARHKETLYSLACDGCGAVFQARGTRTRKLCDSCQDVRRVHPKPCKQCGVLFKRKKRGGRDKNIYCSNACAGKARSEKAREINRVAVQEKLFQKLQKDQRLEAKAIANRERRLCKDLAEWAWFWDAEDRKRRARTRKKRRGPRGSKKHTTRAKKRGLPRVYTITLDKVGDRDNWTCGLCGCLIMDRSSRDGPNSPCIDHIVPLNHPENTRHGHTWDNVQIAHRQCNERKGATLLDRSLLHVTNPRLGGSLPTDIAPPPGWQVPISSNATPSLACPPRKFPEVFEAVS